MNNEIEVTPITADTKRTKGSKPMNKNKKVDEFESALNVINWIWNAVLIIGLIATIAAAYNSGIPAQTVKMGGVGLATCIFFYFVKVLFLGLGYSVIEIAKNTRK